MKTITILAAGQFPRTQYPLYLLQSAEAVVCCDSALSLAEKHGITPYAVVGDLDSVCGRALRRYNGVFRSSNDAGRNGSNDAGHDNADADHNDNTDADHNGNPDADHNGNPDCGHTDHLMEEGSGQRNVIRISEQDTNDLTKAFKYVLDTWPEVEVIHIIGATGKSEAHTIGNISLLMEYESCFNLSSRGISVDMVSDYSTIFAIADSCELHVGQGRKVSIFSPDSMLRISSDGLEWPTDNVIFDNWWKGTLNRASSDIVKLTFNHPSKALVILD